MSEKKRIVFVSNYMVLGGIEKSLLDLLWLLPLDQFDVTLVLRERKGELLSHLPKHVAVVELPLSSIDHYELKHGRIACLKHSLKTLNLRHVYQMLLTRSKWIISGRRISFDFPAFDAILLRTPQFFFKTFDAAVAYFGDQLWSTCVTLTYLKANIKICWTHSEKPEYQQNTLLYQLYYRHFDFRFACSQTTAERINKALGIPNTVKSFPHTLNANRMKELAVQPRVYESSQGIPIILTVARLDQQKGIDIAIMTHKSLLEQGFIHHWYVVGNGNQEEHYRQLIKDSQVESSFFLEGGKTNPYPYFSQCDVYVQPSRFEGYCLAVAEARVFNKPIVATDFDGAREQLKHGITGLIVPVELNALINAIKQLLGSPELRETFSKNLSVEDVDSQIEVKERWLALFKI